MPKIIEISKISVICKVCHSILTFKAKEITHRVDTYSTDCAVPELVKVDRYFIECPKCKNHPNVAKIATDEMKKIAKEK